jgi:two-component system OmpR family sensor kinase
MKKFSIFGIITFMFIMAAIAVVIGYNYNKKYEKEKSKDALNQRYAIVTSSTLYRLISSPLDEDFVNDLHDTFHVNLIINPALRKKIEKESEVLETRKTRIGSGTILYYKERDNNYLLIKSANGSSILVEDTVYKKYVNKIHTIKYIFLGFGLLLFIVYFVIIRKLRPVKKLKSEIDKFASGNLNINCKIDGDDEIAELANAFNHSVEQIRKLNSSRKLFLRNIMHELKTPITKGMITVEMIEDGKQKDRLISTFQRLENLLNEFAAIEQISVDD